MGSNPLGTWIYSSGGRPGDFRHPWLVTVAGGSARVASGIVLANIGLQPVIGGIPIGGDGTNPAPSLKLDRGLVNDANESWVCLEVTPTEAGALDAERKKSKVEVVQRVNPIAMVGPLGRTPLALLELRNNAWRVHQIAMFHFRYETTLPTTGPRRHFFL